MRYNFSPAKFALFFTYQKICMWGPGLAESDGQNNSKFSNFFELITILSPCITVGKVTVKFTKYKKIRMKKNILFLTVFVTI